MNEFHRAALGAKILALAVTNNFRACSVEWSNPPKRRIQQELHGVNVSSAKMNVGASFEIFYILYLFSCFRLNFSSKNEREETEGRIVVTNRSNDFWRKKFDWI